MVVSWLMKIDQKLWCTACKAQDVPLIKYSKRKYTSARTGKTNIYQYYMCRECNSRRSKAYYQTPDGKAAIRRAVKISESTPHGKLRRRAYGQVAYALKTGKLMKASRCNRCDIDVSEAKRLEAHHHDYNRPLDVEWLCTGCHAQETFN